MTNLQVRSLVLKLKRGLLFVGYSYYCLVGGGCMMIGPFF